jgi:signal transduction histidine kinase
VLRGEQSHKGIAARLLADEQLRRELIYAVTIAVTIVAAPTATRKVLVAVILTLSLGLYALMARGPERTAPAALLLCSAGGIAAMLLAPSGVAEWPVLLAAVHSRTLFRGDAGLAVTGVLAILFGGAVGLISHSLVGVIAGLGVPALAARRLGQLELERERDRAVRLLAELEAARDAQAEAAALQERGRIAREMHDVLAHSLAGLSLQLQATRAVAARENVSSVVMEPLERAAELARSGVDEAKAVVGALRSPARPGLGIAEVPALIERFPGAAVLTVDGSPGVLSDSAGHAIYRGVQESLTNAARYAPGSAVSVALNWEPAQLRVVISDQGSAGVEVPGCQGSGQGLHGMQERVAAAGGQLTSGPLGTGWQTEIVVPVMQP